MTALRSTVLDGREAGAASIRFEADPVVTPGLRAGICALWAAVTNAGGAVGFVPPVSAEDVRPELDRLLGAIADGRARLVVGCDPAGIVLATAFLVHNTRPLLQHWLWVQTTMVHPSCQGGGAGRRLMEAVERAARSTEGIRALRLTCRSGMGLEAFYRACGYGEVGRAPGAIRVGPDDYRDEVTLWRALTPAA